MEIENTTESLEKIFTQQITEETIDNLIEEAKKNGTFKELLDKLYKKQEKTVRQKITDEQNVLKNFCALRIKIRTAEEQWKREQVKNKT
ncbi:MAG: hypothetical protein ABH808_00405 [Candidatus Kuenenbacteria bacterium]